MSLDDVLFQEALAEIARGRPDCGRPLGGEKSRQIARQALTERGHNWSLLIRRDPSVNKAPESEGK